MRRTTTPSNGFTLIELLMVMAIIATLLTLVDPIVGERTGGAAVSAQALSMPIR